MRTVLLSASEDRDRALRNGGKVVRGYPDGWLVRVPAEEVGEISYRLADGSVIRRYPAPCFNTY